MNGAFSEPAMDPFPQINGSAQRKMEAVPQFQQIRWGEMLTFSLESFSAEEP